MGHCVVALPTKGAGKLFLFSVMGGDPSVGPGLERNETHLFLKEKMF